MQKEKYDHELLKKEVEIMKMQIKRHNTLNKLIYTIILSINNPVKIDLNILC